MFLKSCPPPAAAAAAAADMMLPLMLMNFRGSPSAPCPACLFMCFSARWVSLLAVSVNYLLSFRAVVEHPD